MNKDALIVAALSMLPRKSGARAMGWGARRRVSRLLTRAFVAAYRVDLSEAALPLEAYPTLEALFTRTLQPGVRPVDASPTAIVSPVDGRVAAVGRTVGGRIEVAPGRALDVAALVGERLPGEMDVVVLYLSPRDYHRVHVAREGLATRWRYVPGTLWPVFPAAVRRVDDLFSRNERAIVVEQTDHGPLWTVLVGAFGVGRITLAVCDLVTNTGGAAAEGVLDPPIPLARGAELGVFHLGSTVVLLAPAWSWSFRVRPGDVVRVGEAIGKVWPALPADMGTDD